jgi:hypothetical protein
MYGAMTKAGREKKKREEQKRNVVDRERRRQKAPARVTKLTINFTLSAQTYPQANLSKTGVLACVEQRKRCYERCLEATQKS